MVTHKEPEVSSVPSTHPPAPASRGGGFPVTAWVLVILGGIAAFLGAFILLGGDDQYIGLGGTSTSWRVGDIAPAWGYGLIAVGVVALLVGLALGLRHRRAAVAEPGSTGGWADVAAHAAIFLVVNAFLWLQDFAIGGGLDYAYWITIPWAIGLAAHAVVCYLDQRELASAARGRPD